MKRVSQETIDRHNCEIGLNQASWERKPLIRKCYQAFHAIVRKNLSSVDGWTVDIGSGIGVIRDTIPDVVCTDLFPNPWIDRVENAYCLRFPDSSVANLILVDVFHHLRYPGEAMREWLRVLKPEGRVILFEPGFGLLGRWIYGAFHPEPVAMRETITWNAPEGWSPEQVDYYAAQGNAHRIFLQRQIADGIKDWNIHACERYAFVSYVSSGGFSRPQLYPTFFFPLLRKVDCLLDRFPTLFATRLCVVLEKRSGL